MAFCKCRSRAASTKRSCLIGSRQSKHRRQLAMSRYSGTYPLRTRSKETYCTVKVTVPTVPVTLPEVPVTVTV